MTHTPPAGRAPIFLLPSTTEGDEHSSTAKAMLAALANIQESAWSGPNETDNGLSFTAPYGDNEKIVVNLQRYPKDNDKDLTLHSISIGTEADRSPYVFLNLRSANITLDKDNLSAQHIKDACAPFVIINHEDLDTIPGLEARCDNQAAYDRILPLIISIITMEIPEQMRSGSIVEIEGWFISFTGKWVLEFGKHGQHKNPVQIYPDNPSALIVENILRLTFDTICEDWSDQEHREKHRHQFVMEPQTQFSTKSIIDPISAMQSIAIINELRTRFTPSKDYPSNS